MHLDTILTTDVFKAFSCPCVYGMTTCPMKFLVLVVVLVELVPWLLSGCTWMLFVPWLGWLIIVMFPSVVIKNFILYLVNGPGWIFTLSHWIPEVIEFLLEKLSVSANCFALWVSVPMTLYLAEILWWLSHCKYWSVWVGFWYTVMDKEPSACGVIKVSRKGIAPFLVYLP